MDTNTIDALLERYLSLLDEYTTLRTKLGQLQTSMFQHLARANFSAERGMRYGPDFYDERMQATRRVNLSLEGDVPMFRVATCDGLVSGSGNGDATENPQSDPVSDPPAEAKAETEKPDEAVPASEEDKVEEKGEQAKKQRSKDPLRWFGVLTPLTLRQTQGCAVEVVEQIIPRLVSVNAAMQDVEIQVRRARKKRAKAEAAAVKEHESGQHQERVAREEVAAS
ncbi:hypothetical protein VMCG_00714 [Cytospora schulzeri]|uniref:Vacuolar ATPase assembly protein VMA22 n=1 Tax=Cytospora schulzeri TaxID=448051 RepID=A0A423X9S6_9PEZI|nr:hypothetical protein VMCG_00714 [Valsa malicola]